MLQLLDKNIDAGTGLMTFEIVSVVKQRSKLCCAKFCLSFVAYLLKHLINARGVFLVAEILIAIKPAYFVFKFLYVVCA